MSSSASAALSGALKALADSPLDFLNEYPIVLALSTLPPEYRSADGLSFRSGKAGVKLVKSKTVPAIYNLQFVAIKDMENDREAVDAYVLRYVHNGNDDVPFVDIPIKAYVENTLLFTVGLTGCSVIVTSLDKDTYRVFHDRRADSSVLYSNVQMRVDFNDYRIGGRYLSHTGSAITLMLFKGGAWNMFLQRQLSEPSSLPSEVYAVEVQQTGPMSEKAFNDRRTILQKRVKANGKNLRVDNSLIAGAVDGIVQGVGYNEQAIRGWKALRSAIKSKIDVYRDDPDKDPTLNETYVRFDFDNAASDQIDETWIWLQINKNRA